MTDSKPAAQQANSVAPQNENGDSVVRDQFETAFVEEEVSRFGAGYRDCAIHMLKRDGEFEGTPTAYELSRREQGMYDNYWIEMLWWAWQASRQAVAVDVRSAAKKWFYQSFDCDLLEKMEKTKLIAQAEGFSISVMAELELEMEAAIESQGLRVGVAK